MKIYVRSKSIFVNKCKDIMLLHLSYVIVRRSNAKKSNY